MPSRWTILAGGIGAVAPQLSQSLGASLADIGILIGIYFAPGVLLAFPGGAIGRRYGDKATVLAAILAMLAGELLMTASASWSVQIAGRLIAGTGGILLSVLMTKMVADWFAGREIATAMAIFVNSWPVGIAISLMLLPWIATRFGLHLVNLAVAGWILIGLVLMAFFYRAPEAAVSVDGESGSVTSETVYAVIAASSIWCLYNLGLVMIFSFGPTMLVERGWSMAAAGSTISIVLWLTAISVPFGGFLADLTKRGEAIIVAGCIGFALLTVLLSRSGQLLLAASHPCPHPASPHENHVGLFSGFVRNTYRRASASARSVPLKGGRQAGTFRRSPATGRGRLAEWLQVGTSPFELCVKARSHTGTSTHPRLLRSDQVRLPHDHSRMVGLEVFVRRFL